MFAVPFYDMSNTSGSKAWRWSQLHIGAKIFSIILYCISLLGISGGIYLLVNHYPISFIIIILTGAYVIIATSIIFIVKHSISRSKNFILLTSVIIVGFGIASFCLLISIDNESYCGLMWSCNNSIVNSQVKWSHIMSNIQYELNVSVLSYNLVGFCNGYNDPTNSTSYHNKTNIASQLANYTNINYLYYENYNNQPIRIQENQLITVDTSLVKGIDLGVSSFILAYGIYLLVCGLNVVKKRPDGALFY